MATNPYAKYLEPTATASEQQNPYAKYLQQEQSEADLPSPEPGFFGDSRRHIVAATKSGVAGDLEAAHHITGSEWAGRKADDWEASAERTRETLSRDAKEAMQKAWVEETRPEPGKFGEVEYSLGPAWGDIDAWNGVISNAVGSFLPMLAGGGVTSIATKAALRGAGRAAGRQAARQVALKKALDEGGEKAEKALAKKYASRDAAIGSAVNSASYGLNEGAMVGGMVAREIESHILEMPAETLSQAPLFQEVYWAARDEGGVGHEEAFAQARSATAKALAEKGLYRAGIPAVLLGTVAGRYIDKALAGKLQGSRKLRAAKGAGVEGGTETLQEGAEHLAEGYTIQEADSSRDPYEGLANTMVAGAIGGTSVGGGLGALSRTPKDIEGEVKNRRRVETAPEMMEPEIEAEIRKMEEEAEYEQGLEAARQQITPNFEVEVPLDGGTMPESAPADPGTIDYNPYAQYLQPLETRRETPVENGIEFEPTQVADQKTELELAPKEQQSNGIDYEPPSRTDALAKGLEERIAATEEANVDDAGAEAPVVSGRSGLPDSGRNAYAPLIFRKNDEPFKTEKAALISDTFRKTPGAEVVAVDDGFAVRRPAPELELETRANQAATSPQNDLPEPTDAQKEAGNYKVGRVKLHGLDISIENPRGSTRSGTSPDGKRWENKLPHHYGYIRKTEGADGDHVDVFVGKDIDSEKVFVVDQVNPDGSFDEHKALISFSNKLKAIAGYKGAYDKGWKVGPITEMTLKEFKNWVKNGDTTKPVSQSTPEVTTAVKERQPTRRKKREQPQEQLGSSGDMSADKIFDMFVGSDSEEAQGTRDKPSNVEVESQAAKENRSTYASEDATDERNTRQVQGAAEKSYPDTTGAKPADETGIPGVQGHLFAPSGIPAETAREQSRDNFLLRYEQVPSGVTFRSAFDTVNTPEEVAHVLAPGRKHGQETMLALVTDDRGKILNLIRHSKGAKNAASVYPAELAGAIAATDGAARVWFAHNHPSGDSGPSQADLRVTDKLVDKLENSGIDVAGHVVIGRGRDASFFTDSYDTPQRIQTTAAPRRKTIPLTERVIRKQPPPDRRKVTSPDEAKAIARDIESDDAILLLDNHHHELGVVVMSPAEMRKLRDGGRVRRLLRAVDATNASAVIIKTSDPEGAGRNVARFFNNLEEVQVLDVMSPYHGRLATALRSSAEQGLGIEGDKEYFYSLSDSANSKGIKPEVARGTLATLQKKLGVAAKVVADESALPAALRQKVEADGVQGRVRGLYDAESGTAYIVAGNLGRPRDAARAYLHEVVGHKGIRAATGKRLDLVLTQIYKDMPAEARDALERKYRSQLDGQSAPEAKRTVADEYVAHLAESDPQNSLLQNIVSIIRRWLRQLYPAIKWTQADVIELLARGKRALRRGEGGKGQGVRYGAERQSGRPGSRPVFGNDPRTALWTLIAQHDEAFQLPTSSARDLETIFHDTATTDTFAEIYAADEMAQQMDEDPDRAWRIDMVNGNEVRFTRRAIQCGWMCPVSLKARPAARSTTRWPTTPTTTTWCLSAIRTGSRTWRSPGVWKI